MTTTPTQENRAGRKRPRGVSSSQPVTVLDLENSPPDLGDAPTNPVRALAYIKAFIVDGEPLPATDKVRPWREGRGDKIA